MPRNNLFPAGRAARRRALAACLAVAALAAVVPEGVVSKLRGWTHAFVRPAVEWGNRGRDALAGWGGPWLEVARADRRQLALRVARLESEVATLRQERELLLSRLRGQALDAHQSAIASTADDREPTALSQPLVTTTTIEARVLGRQARSYLAQHGILAALDPGLARGALVIDPAGAAPGPADALDLGSDAGLRRGQRVLAGLRVWGQINDVGPLTATVLRVNQRGYRDLVEIRPADSPNEPAARGVLHGVGEPLCRVHYVDARAAIRVGDRVTTAENESLGRGPLDYGEIVRAECPRGAAHWAIWVRPAAAGPLPPRVAVTRAALNPSRLAEAERTIR